MLIVGPVDVKLQRRSGESRGAREGGEDGAGRGEGGWVAENAYAVASYSLCICTVRPQEPP